MGNITAYINRLLTLSIFVWSINSIAVFARSDSSTLLDGLIVFPLSSARPKKTGCSWPACFSDRRPFAIAVYETGDRLMQTVIDKCHDEVCTNRVNLRLPRGQVLVQSFLIRCWCTLPNLAASSVQVRSSERIYVGLLCL